MSHDSLLSFVVFNKSFSGFPEIKQVSLLTASVEVCEREEHGYSHLSAAIANKSELSNVRSVKLPNSGQIPDFRILSPVKLLDLQAGETPSIFVGVLCRVPSNT